MSGPRITAIAPWFGSKRTLAPKIIEEIGEHIGYWEPFGGGLSVILQKPLCRSETVNDLHGDLINLARVIAGHEGPELFARLSRTMFCEAIHQDAKSKLGDVDLSPVDRAYWFFVESWMGRGGVAGTRKNNNTSFCLRFTTNGGDPATRFRNAVNSIPDWAERLRSVWILQRDAFELIERIEDKVGTVIYADPPYVEKSGKYLHDFDAADHAKLSELLHRFKRTRVIVSYYAHPTLDELYPVDRWTHRPLSGVKYLANSFGKCGPTAAPELLIINGPSYAAKEAA